MLQTTRWSPDTCDCIFEITWDDTEDERTRTHSLKTAVNLCQHHRALGSRNAYDQVFSENSRKNIAFAEAQKIRPDLTLDDYTWSFDADRKLKVGFLGKLTDAQRKNLQTQGNSRFGSDKVEVI